MRKIFGGRSVTKVPIIDQIDKFFSSKRVKKEKNRERALEKIYPKKLSSLQSSIFTINFIFVQKEI
jgi:hypothetical protein